MNVKCMVTPALFLAMVATGCALTSKSDSVILHYFTPERVAPSPTPTSAVAPVGAALQLRLGRVTAAAYLRERIAFRDSDYEVGFYDDLRWTERPEAYVRRAMTRGLFQEQPIRQVVSGGAPTLDIDIIAFEELRAPRHAARVQITWTLYDSQTVVEQKTLLVEQAIREAVSNESATAVASALAAALDDAVKQVVTGVMTSLAAHPPVADMPPTPPATMGDHVPLDGGAPLRPHPRDSHRPPHL